MALIKCKECGKEISSEAKICPHCGKKNEKNSGCSIVFMLMFLFFAMIGALVGNKNDSSSAVSTTEDDNIIYPDSVYPKAVIEKLDAAIAEADNYRQQAISACTQNTGNRAMCDCITKVWAVERPRLYLDYYRAMITQNHELQGRMVAQQGMDFMNKIANCGK